MCKTIERIESLEPEQVECILSIGLSKGGTLGDNRIHHVRRQAENAGVKIGNAEVRYLLQAQQRQGNNGNDGERPPHFRRRHPARFVH
jgi:hypothetical protein